MIFRCECFCWADSGEAIKKWANGFPIRVIWTRTAQFTTKHRFIYYRLFSDLSFLLFLSVERKSLFYFNLIIYSPIVGRHSHAHGIICAAVRECFYLWQMFCYNIFLTIHFCQNLLVCNCFVVPINFVLWLSMYYAATHCGLVDICGPPYVKGTCCFFIAIDGLQFTFSRTDFFLSLYFRKIEIWMQNKLTAALGIHLSNSKCHQRKKKSNNMLNYSQSMFLRVNFLAQNEIYFFPPSFTEIHEEKNWCFLRHSLQALTSQHLIVF